MNDPVQTGKYINLKNKVNVLYLQGGKVTYEPNAKGLALRAVTVLTPKDFDLEEGKLYKENADIASFFVTVGESVRIEGCPRCGRPVDVTEIRHPPGLTPTHTCE